MLFLASAEKDILFRLSLRISQVYQMVILIQPAIPFFQGNGYEIWSAKMRTLFISEDLWELVDEGYAEEEITRDDAKVV